MYWFFNANQWSWYILYPKKYYLYRNILRCTICAIKVNLVLVQLSFKRTKHYGYKSSYTACVSSPHILSNFFYSRNYPGWNFEMWEWRCWVSYLSAFYALFAHKSLLFKKFITLMKGIMHQALFKMSYVSPGYFYAKLWCFIKGPLMNCMSFSLYKFL